jgi:hypothetical protein
MTILDNPKAATTPAIEPALRAAIGRTASMAVSHRIRAINGADRARCARVSVPVRRFVEIATALQDIGVNLCDMLPAEEQTAANGIGRRHVTTAVRGSREKDQNVDGGAQAAWMPGLSTGPSMITASPLQPAAMSAASIHGRADAAARISA